MIRALAARCDACGAEARRLLNPGVALGFGALGAYLIWIGETVAWYGGVGVMHEVLGGMLVVLSVWGVVADARALARGRDTSRFWLDTRSHCGACGSRTGYSGDVRLTRVLLLATLALIVYLQWFAARL